MVIDSKNILEFGLKLLYEHDDNIISVRDARKVFMKLNPRARSLNSFFKTLLEYDKLGYISLKQKLYHSQTPYSLMIIHKSKIAKYFIPKIINNRE